MNYESVDSIGIGGQAAALWLLLSIDKKLEPDQSYRLDDLFGLSPSEQEGEEDGEEREECRKAEAKFVKARNRFLDTLDGLDASERTMPSSMRSTGSRNTRM